MTDLGPGVLLLIYILGLGLFLVEVFVPSGGVLGAAAVLFVGFALWELFHRGDAPLAITCIALTIVYLIVLVRWSFHRLQLRADLSGGESTGSDVREARGMIGVTGEAVTALRPAGVALLDGRRFDVVTRGDFVDAGAPVRVVETSGNRIVVKPI